MKPSKRLSSSVRLKLTKLRARRIVAKAKGEALRQKLLTATTK